MNWIITRFREASTWRGLFVVAGIFGLSLSPEMQEQIVTICVAAIGIVEIVRREKDGRTGSGATDLGTGSTGETSGGPAGDGLPPA